MSLDDSPQQSNMSTFSQLIASRREWIEAVLRPWCRRAALRDLRLADSEWVDIAGKVDSAATLWTWAWSRFPELVHENLPGIDETSEVEITLATGETRRGYPDSRAAGPGELVLLSSERGGGRRELGPFSIDEIVGARRVFGRGM